MHKKIGKLTFSISQEQRNKDTESNDKAKVLSKVLDLIGQRNVRLSFSFFYSSQLLSVEKLSVESE